jgi:hypothetical protein
VITGVTGGVHCSWQCVSPWQRSEHARDWGGNQVATAVTVSYRSYNRYKPRRSEAASAVKAWNR